jgi:hypothetical protein
MRAVPLRLLNQGLVFFPLSAQGRGGRGGLDEGTSVLPVGLFSILFNYVRRSEKHGLLHTTFPSLSSAKI